MHTVTSWIERKLGLKVNMTKTKVTKPGGLKYLGFGFWKSSDGWKARPHQDSILKFKRKLKQLTKRNWSASMDYRIDKEKLVSEYGLQNRETKSSDTWVDKLF